MHISPRFGNVTVFLSLSPQDGERMKSPSNRVVYCDSSKEVYLVSGPDDIAHVDSVMMARKAIQTSESSGDGGKEKSSRINNGLLRWLWNKATGVSTSNEFYSTCTLEVL